MNGESHSQPPCSSNCRFTKNTSNSYFQFLSVLKRSPWNIMKSIHWNPLIFLSEFPSKFLPFLRRGLGDLHHGLRPSCFAVAGSAGKGEIHGKTMGYFHAKMNRMFGNVWDIKGYVVFINWTIYFWYNLLGHLWDTEIFHGFCGDQYNAHNGM